MLSLMNSEKWSRRTKEYNFFSINHFLKTFYKIQVLREIRKILFPIIFVDF